MYSTQDVLDIAGIDLTEGDIAAELNIEQPEITPAITEESVDEFREFLKDLSPEDFIDAAESDEVDDDSEGENRDEDRTNPNNDSE